MNYRFHPLMKVARMAGSAIQADFGNLLPSQSVPRGSLMLLLKRVDGLVVRLSFSSTNRKSKDTPSGLCKDVKVLCRY